MPSQFTLFGYTVATRVLAVLAAIVLLAALAFAVPSCLQKHHSQAAQARVDASQAQAASISAADAINAVAASGGRETASESLTRSNGQEIRAAQGAEVRVGAGVNAAGRSALCRRAAYANDPKCKGAK